MKITKSLKESALHSSPSNQLRPLALAISIALTGFSPTISHATTYTVTNTNDSGTGSLRQAVLDANANAGTDEILFDSMITGSTINLTSDQLSITDNLKIQGPVDKNPTGIIISGTNNLRIISSTHSVLLDNLTITNGNGTSQVGGQGRGGAIMVNSNGSSQISLTLNHSVVSNSSTAGAGNHGGGIFVAGEININNSHIINNSTMGQDAIGGGVSARSAFITESNILNNTVFGSFSRGGGVSLNSPSTIVNSTLSGNKLLGGYSCGAGLFNSSTTEIEQSTISNNIASEIISSGGGVCSNGDITLIQSTVTENSSTRGAGGIHIYENFYYGYGSNNLGTTIKNSILANNSAPEGNSFLGELNIFSSGDNTLNVVSSIFGDGSTELDGINNSNIFSNSPGLGPLQDNGGPTLTHLPNPASPVINKGSNTDIPSSTDQRGAGFTRILNGAVDIGAVEVPQPISIYAVLKRAEVVKPILQAVHGATFIPPEASGTEYTDVEIDDFNSDWIAQFKLDGLTEGCDTDKFCPNAVVTKDELAKLIVKAKLGAAYTPMPAIGLYVDVPIGSFNADWIETLNLQGFTTGCDTGRYCPKQVVTHEIFNNILNAAFP